MLLERSGRFCGKLNLVQECALSIVIMNEKEEKVKELEVLIAHINPNSAVADSLRQENKTNSMPDLVEVAKWKENLDKMLEHTAPIK